MKLLMWLYADKERTSQLRGKSGEFWIYCSQGSSLDFAGL